MHFSLRSRICAIDVPAHWTRNRIYSFKSVVPAVRSLLAATRWSTCDFNCGHSPALNVN